MDKIYLSEEELYTYFDTLEHFQDKGINIFVDDKCSSSKKDWIKVLELCENEIYYMADFIDDQIGNLKEIRFNKIKVKRNNSENL